MKAYLSAMAELGVVPYAGFDCVGPPEERVRQLLGETSRPTGFVCFDDETALAAIRALAEAEAARCLACRGVSSGWRDCTTTA